MISWMGDLLNLFQSTRPARGATPPAEPASDAPVEISIHAPREGRDRGLADGRRMAGYFNPRAPRGARRQSVFAGVPEADYFNPRAPRGARRCGIGGVPVVVRISIHAPREGRDCERKNKSSSKKHFNPRAPRGARRQFRHTRNNQERISIHAPREGRDSKSEQISLHIFAKKAWIPDIFAQNAAFQSVLPLADRQKLLYLRCEPLRKFLRAFASHYKIIGSSGR